MRKPNNYKELAEKIVRYCAENRISISDFALKCGLTCPTIYNIINGYQHASKLTIAKIEMGMEDKK